MSILEKYIVLLCVCVCVAMCDATRNQVDKNVLKETFTPKDRQIEILPTKDA